MTEISFSKLIPSGNPTIIITAPLPQGNPLPAVAASLMDPMHLQAEQVGLLTSDGQRPHLQMMGDEFCVNATRSAALLLALQGKLTPMAVTAEYKSHCWHGTLTVSGANAPLTCLVAPEEEVLAKALSLAPSFLPASVKNFPIPTQKKMFVAVRLHGGKNFSLNAIEPGVTLVSLPGITHLLVDATIHPMQKQWHEQAAFLRKRHNLLHEAASGIIWFSSKPDRCSIVPAVAVQATGSEHLETACGSGSLAMALMLRQNHSMAEAPGNSFVIYQPSGKALTISFEGNQKNPFPDAAWVSGEVMLVAQGNSYIF